VRTSSFSMPIRAIPPTLSRFIMVASASSRWFKKKSPKKLRPHSDRQDLTAKQACGRRDRVSVSLPERILERYNRPSTVVEALVPRTSRQAVGTTVSTMRNDPSPSPSGSCLRALSGKDLREML